MVLWVLAAAGCSAARTSYLSTEDHFPVAYEMKRASQPRGAVLLVHGLGSSLDEWYTLGKALRKEGWTTLAVDLRGHGESTYLGKDEIRWNEMTVEGRLSSLRDVEAAAVYLKKQVPEAENNLWIAGSSFGAALALRYAVSDPEVRGVILLSPGLKFGGVDIEEAASAYRQRPVLMAAARDDFGAVRAAETIAGLIPSPDKKVLIREEAGHGAPMLDASPDLKKEVLAWLNEASSRTPENTSV